MAKYIKLEDLMKFPIRLDHYDKEHGSKDFVYGIETVLEYAENLQTTDAAQEWISVKDRVPKNSGRYLVVHRNKHDGSTSIAITAYIKCRVGEWWSNDYVYNVTHWMPLPEMPKGGIDSD